MYSRRLNTERLDRHRDDRMQRLDRDRLDMKVNKHKKNHKSRTIPKKHRGTKKYHIQQLQQKLPYTFKATNKCRITTHKLINKTMTEYIPLYFFISFQFVFQGYKIVSVSLIFVPKI